MNEAVKAQRRLSRQKLRERRRSLGLCDCGKPSREGFRSCEACRDKANALSRKHNHLASRRESKRRWRLKNPEKQRTAVERWNAANRGRRRERMNSWRKLQAQTNPAWVIEQRLRARLNKKLRRAQMVIKQGPTLKILGCSRAQLVEHIARQFLPGMTWENRNEWHVDHIQPCASFDLTDPEQQKACFHFSNLRPRWANENQLAGANYRWQKYRDNLEQNNA